MVDLAAQFERFAAELRARFRDARVELTSFPSGAQDLGFWWRERFWVLEYGVSHNEFGVDEVGEHDGYGVGYNHVFSDFASAQQKLLSLLSAESSDDATLEILD